MRYVTFYYDLLREHVTDLKVHPDKEAAIKHFNMNYKRYFQLCTPFKTDKLPASYGYPMRKYYGVSVRGFKNMFGVSIDEVLRQMQEDKG